MTVACRLCGGEAEETFTGRVLGSYDVKYYFCEKCGFLETEKPYWLNEAYADAINSLDTGIMARNISKSKLVACIIHQFFGPAGRYLDYGGGYGILTRLMRDMGFDFKWYDPYSENLLARGFEYDSGEEIDLVTSFETFEHFTEPATDICRIMKISPNLIFSTEVLPNPIPRPGEWWYYGMEHGQHISFYSQRTLEYIAKLYRLNLYSVGGLHIFTPKNINMLKLRSISKFNGELVLPLIRWSMRSRAFDDMTLMARKASSKHA